jgi:hypothetical protein
MSDHSNTSDLTTAQMESTPATIRDLARRLMALETSHDATPAKSGSDAARVCEKLRVPLAKLAGKAGYHSLISRAIAIAKANAPALGPVEVRLDGSLEGFDEIGEHDAEAGVAVLVHLLNLLVTFIGEPVTLGLVRDAWPDATLEKTNPSAEEQS